MFSHRGVVYAYQSGFDLAFADSNNWRPGLVTHVLAIEASLATGALRYHFMAGDQRYKRQLSTHVAHMDWASLQRPRWKFAVERLLRTARERLRPTPPSAE